MVLTVHCNTVSTILTRYMGYYAGDECTPLFVLRLPVYPAPVVLDGPSQGNLYLWY
jgi:hypothetical protein